MCMYIVYVYAYVYAYMFVNILHQTMDKDVWGICVLRELCNVSIMHLYRLHAGDIFKCVFI